MSITVKNITDQIGADAICARLGVTSHSVRGVRARGEFPARWYAGIKLMCAEKGIDCPDGLFNFIEPAPVEPAE